MKNEEEMYMTVEAEIEPHLKQVPDRNALIETLSRLLSDIDNLIKFCIKIFGPLIQSVEPEILHTQEVKTAKKFFKNLTNMEYGYKVLCGLPWGEEGCKFFLEDEALVKRILAHSKKAKEHSDVKPVSPVQAAASVPVPVQFVTPPAGVGKFESVFNAFNVVAPSAASVQCYSPVSSAKNQAPAPNSLSYQLDLSTLSGKSQVAPKSPHSQKSTP